MSKLTQLPQLQPRTGGGDSGGMPDCMIIEKVDNGYVLRTLIGGDDEAGMLQECKVYLDRSELLRDLAARL